MGRRDMFAGLGTSVVGYAQFTAISFATYFAYRDHLDALFPGGGPLNKLAAGGLAGQTAICVTYPTDLVRRRLQLQRFDFSVPVYDGAIDCVRRILLAEGVSGLYRGFAATSLKLCPTTAIQFLVIDVVGGIIKRRSTGVHHE